MRLDRLILDNFLTYEHLDYSFEQKPVLIQGLNLTEDDQGSNGSGKSGLQTGIEFCITASNSRDTRDSELITFGKSSARTQLFASCDQRKQHLHIDWTINKKGSNKLELKTKKYEEEEWTSVNFSNVNDGKRWILNWFAISKEDLFNYYIINASRFKSFFRSSNKEKVDLINRFTDASIIEGLENIDTQKEESAAQKVNEKIYTIKGKIELTQENLEKELARDINKEKEEQKEKLREKIRDFEDEIENIKFSIDGIEPQKKSIKKDISTKEKEIEELKQKQKDIEKDILIEKKKLKEVEEEYSEAEELVDNFEETDWDKKTQKYKKEKKEKKTDLKTKEENKQSLEKKEEKILKLIQSINVKLSGTITCPKCSHKFLLDGDLDALQEKLTSAEEIKKKVKDLKEVYLQKIEKTKGEISAIESKVSEINKKEQVEWNKKKKLEEALHKVQKKIDEIERKKNRLEDDKRRVERNIENTKIDIENLKKDIKNLKKEKESLQKEITVVQKEIDGVEQTIDNFSIEDNKKEIKALKTDINSFTKELNFQEKLLTKVNEKIYEKNKWKVNFKSFRMFLANQSLKIIEYHNNRYLKEMGSDMMVKLNGFKIKADGTEKEEITATIIRDIERTFSSFSKGERGRLLFASVLANRFMINSTNIYGGLDFLSIDEIFEGVDPEGLQAIFNSAKTLKIPVQIVTHVTHEDADTDVITIVKENGKSYIKK